MGVWCLKPVRYDETFQEHLIAGYAASSDRSPVPKPGPRKARAGPASASQVRFAQDNESDSDYGE